MIEELLYRDDNTAYRLLSECIHGMAAWDHVVIPGDVLFVTFDSTSWNAMDRYLPVMAIV
jgi:hypothetical protein